MHRGEVRWYRFEVLLTEADGMSHACAVNLDHIHMVAKGKIGPVITTYS
jgi:mRNA-degrading endonuclease toxin of MazEF toxin-antitoxin module